MDLTDPTPSTEPAIARTTLTDLVACAEARGRAGAPSSEHGSVLSRYLFLFAGAADELAAAERGGREFVACITEADGSARLDATATVAARDRKSWIVSGVKCFVPFAARANTFLVAARGSGKLGVFAVDARAPGVALTPIPTLGLDEQCEIAFDQSPAIAVATDATDALEQAIARALITLCGEAVGAARAALDHTVEHVTTREQWSAPIGTFQAVQHRCADMLIDVTTARDAVYDAAGAVDRGEDAQLAASRAKAFAIDACRRVTAAAHQLNGGEGIYADQPVHLWYRRVKAIEPMYGSPDFHRARVAAALLGSRGEPNND